MYKGESRIIVLNCGASAAGQVLKQAETFGLTRDGYAWIVSDGVTGNFVSTIIESHHLFRYACLHGSRLKNCNCPEMILCMENPSMKLVDKDVFS